LPSLFGFTPQRSPILLASVAAQSGQLIIVGPPQLFVKLIRRRIPAGLPGCLCAAQMPGQTFGRKDIHQKDETLSFCEIKVKGFSSKVPPRRNESTSRLGTSFAPVTYIRQ
jgi:hypothetical protein